MAEIRSIYTDKRKNSTKRIGYVEGTTVRKMQTKELPDRSRERKRRIHTGRARREKAERMGPGYAFFLFAACALTLWVCVGYLQLQADNTARVKNIASLESQLTELKQENDEEYNRVVISVDLEEIREIAINELGMVYAQEDQVVLYDGEGSDYVKQYADIPESESGLQGLFSIISR